MKSCKEGIKIAEQLSKVDLDKFICSYQCYKCIYWNDYCMANLVKSIIQKSNKYLENHKE